MRINPQELRKFVEENPKLVTRKQSTRYPKLYVLKYTRDVFYKRLWDKSPFLLECRGLVVDENYNVVIKPFTKVFNYGENGTTINRDEFCTWVRKVNGFLGVVTYAPHVSDELIYSTTGSLDSDFVDLIEKHVSPFAEKIKEVSQGRQITLMFEICDSQEDPHIIPEKDGAWLIGMNPGFFKIKADSYSLNEHLLNEIAEKIGFMRPEMGRDQFDDIVKMANACDHEGYMVYGSTSKTALKIKSPYYLTSKFLARMSPKKMAQILASDQASISNFDEEYFPLIETIRANKDEFQALEEQQRLDYIRKFLKETNNNVSRNLLHK